MTDIEFRPAEVSEAPAIADLLSDGFSLDVQPILLYKCSGAAAFIAAIVKQGLPNCESAYFVACIIGKCIAAVELRRQPAGLVLNYIGVREEYRGKGLAGALLKAAVERVSDGKGRIVLDVLEENALARNWYNRLGFVLAGQSEILEIAPDQSDEPPAYISDIPQADLSQERFGFSQFRLISALGTFAIGRIGERWFRMTDPAAVSDPSVYAALQSLDARRSVLAVLPARSASEDRVRRRLAIVNRMEMKIDHMVDALSRDR
jgi:ribosomal protein S18 acetylase RimI-like enzyme